MEYFEDLYEDPKGSKERSRVDLEDSRDSAMQWMDEYYETPEDLKLVSDRLEALTDYNSEYMIEAQRRSEEERRESGYLESGFGKGVGATAAIDRAYQVAMEDVYVDSFNTGEQNKANLDEYYKAYQTAMKALNFQGSLSVDEYSYNLIVQKMDDFQQDKIELLDEQFEYSSVFQKQAHDDRISRQQFSYSNDLAMQLARNDASISDKYLLNYAQIISSDINQPSKYDLLYNMESNMAFAKNAMRDYQDVRIGDSPYDISYIDMYTPPGVGDRADDAFNWNAKDANFEYVKFMEMLQDIRHQIHSSTNHQERDASTLWYTANDLLYKQLTTIDKNSQAYFDKMDYYHRMKGEVLGTNPSNDEIEQFFRDIYEISNSQEEAESRHSYKIASINRPVYSFDDFGGLPGPFTYDVTTWDSTTGELIKTPITVEGHPEYYTAVYSQYDECMLGEWSFNCTKPDGYDEAKASCLSPNTWSDGQCRTPGELWQNAFDSWV